MSEQKEQKEQIKGLVNDAFKGLEDQVDGKMQSFLDSKKEDIAKEMGEKGFTSKEDVQSQIKEAKDDLENTILEVKKSVFEKKKSNKSFKGLLTDAMKENKETLTGLKNKSIHNGGIKIKADEDLNPGNFSNNALEEAKRGTDLYQAPRANFWLRNIIPNASTDRDTIMYLVENGFEGKADIWDGTGSISSLDPKPGVAPKFDIESKTVETIAGITRVKREMLDDIGWLRSYLSQQLLSGRYGLFVAENTQITNELDSNSVSYDGDNDVPVEVLYDAAFGQLRDHYYTPSAILMNNRDVINLIALNKSDGSGQYDLPTGTVAVIGNQLTLGGVPVYGLPNIEKNDYIVMDTDATQFVNRMNPEIRFFEQDRDNVSHNLVTVRAEERVAPIVFDKNAVISGEFDTDDEEV